MRHSRFFLAGMISLFLTSGYGMIGCGDDEGDIITVDLAQLCSQSLQDMNSQGCMHAAYTSVDALKNCVSACGPADEECLDTCFEAPGSGFSSCTDNVEFLFAGQCGECPTECGFDFVDDAPDPGCLFDPNTPPTGTQCLDVLYACVNGC